MRHLMLRSIIVVLAITSSAASYQSYAQDGIGIGASGIYNFNTNGIGVGLRAYIPVKDKWAVIPQLNWFPPFNTVSGFYPGVSAQYNFWEAARFTGYVMGSGHISISAKASASAGDTSSSVSKSESHDIGGEVGAGLLFGHRCIVPFAEYRYNPVTSQSLAHVGLYWFPRCSGSGGGHKSKGHRKSSGSRSRGRDRCPAYD
jgi:hypothetical protein